MCVRFYIDRSNDELDDIVNKARHTKLADRFAIDCNPMSTEGEIRPADVVPVIAPNPFMVPSLYPMKWGYRNGDKGTLLFNARSESADSKPTFREDWARRRCIVPASYYFEWEHLTDAKGHKRTGAKYLIQPKGYSITWLCGLYHIVDGFPYFVILTREPGESVRMIHDRMPLILPKELIPKWTDPGTDPKQLLSHALTDMVTEKV